MPKHNLPPITAYHIIWSTYGFWLPNDPRGSWSKEVWAPKLNRFGPPIPANTRRWIAAKPHDRKLRLAAKTQLLRPPVQFTLPQLECIGNAIGEEVRKYELPVFAAAMMPDHVHLVIKRQGPTAEEWIGYFKRAGSRALRESGLHPFLDHEGKDGRLPTPWVEGGWTVFLHTPAEILSRIKYVRNNPMNAGLPPQDWEWVVEYDG